jgi:transcription elongation factor Elf1
MMIGKKIDTAFECVECGNTDNDTLMILRDAPHVVECCKCGHPNDARWDHDMIDVFRSGAT